MPATLSALFNLRENTRICRLAHVTMLESIGGSRLQGAEGMLRVGLATRNDSVVVTIAQIEGMAHLIPLEPDASWLVNNSIDLETWKTMYN